MASQTVSTCNHYAAGCTKTSTKILHQKNSKKESRYTYRARKKAKPGAFWVLEGVAAVGERIKLGAKKPKFEPKRTPFPCTTCKKKPAETQCFRRVFVAGAEGLEPSARGFGVDVETAHRERGRDKVAPFYQPSHKTGGAGLVLSEKTSGSSVLLHLSQNDCFYLRFVL